MDKHHEIISFSYAVEAYVTLQHAVCVVAHFGRFIKKFLLLFLEKLEGLTLNYCHKYPLNNHIGICIILHIKLPYHFISFSPPCSI